ncbi:methylated-DNA--[protein]-cysteine S-methyltransferase [Streptomyces monashensis]|nr:methylated-DNA--[protein]-cysteine S-methyltransferase [Streptomyces monashensis]
MLTLAATGEALVYCGFRTPDVAEPRVPDRLTVPWDATPAQRAVLDEARAQLDAYLGGRLRTFTLPLDLRRATAFVRETVVGLEEFVPYGRTSTYGELAKRLGRPKAARAVGRALGANPLCVVLPCHRIVGASGQLTGYAGGSAAKKYLLDLEAAG